jgi:hypothetical protein
MRAAQRAVSRAKLAKTLGLRSTETRLAASPKRVMRKRRWPRSPRTAVVCAPQVPELHSDTVRKGALDAPPPPVTNVVARGFWGGVSCIELSPDEAATGEAHWRGT